VTLRDSVDDAGTRPRDPAANDQRDDDLAFEMLLNPKEHEEFTIVRRSVQSALGDVCATPVRVPPPLENDSNHHRGESRWVPAGGKQRLEPNSRASAEWRARGAAGSCCENTTRCDLSCP
jgi:hypothetical protein